MTRQAAIAGWRRAQSRQLFDVRRVPLSPARPQLRDDQETRPIFHEGIPNEVKQLRGNAPPFPDCSVAGPPGRGKAARECIPRAR